MNYRTLIAVFLGVVCVSAQAEQRWFEVELLLFQRNVAIKDIQEHLSSKEITVDTENSIRFLEAMPSSNCENGTVCLSKQNPTIITGDFFDADGNNFQRLDSSQLQLVEQRKILEQHASFSPVFHMVWRMPVESGRTAKPIHLFAGKNLAFAEQQRQLQAIKLNISDAISTEIVEQDAQTDSLQQVDTQPKLTSADKWAIDGNFKVYLDHYLYVDSQLIIRKEVTEDVSVTQPVNVEVIDDQNGVQIAAATQQEVAEVKQKTVIKEILFDQNRRLRSEEIHYLDHPLMGIIVQIRKIPKS